VQPRDRHDRRIEGKGVDIIDVDMDHPSELRLVLLQAQDLVFERRACECAVGGEIGPDSEDEDDVGVFDALVAAGVGVVDSFS